ncbi:Protein NEN4 [Hibiscus syriacus]|uniref:Protein NEN4 n=1 Tax=Hibiscus syriacus TaxID=106335 RepID=A0A6A2Y4J0_HIBSY|nr:Protein NEN4 [Hibiscus syriacus]
MQLAPPPPSDFSISLLCFSLLKWFRPLCPMADPKSVLRFGNHRPLAGPRLLNSRIRCHFMRRNGISRNDVVSAPSFSEIAGKVHDLLHGRVWAGHNIVRFDCVRIREAFEKIGRPAPEPKGIIDSLPLLTRRFGRRAGNMKMATLAKSLDDVRMNLEVVKYCATVLFLESSLPDILMRSWGNIQSSPQQPIPNMNNFSSSLSSENVQNRSPRNSEHHPIISLLTHHTGEAYADVSNPVQPDPLDVGVVRNEMKTETLPSDVTMGEKTQLEFQEIDIAEGSSSNAEFLGPNEVSLSSIRASLIPYYGGTHRIRLLRENIALQLFCPRLRVRFGVDGKFLNQAGRPKLSFVADASPSLCEILDACDKAAKTIFEDCGSRSTWKSIVRRNVGTSTIGDREAEAEIHRKDSSGTVQKVVFSKCDAAELGNLFRYGIFVDASSVWKLRLSGDGRHPSGGEETGYTFGLTAAAEPVSESLPLPSPAALAGVIQSSVDRGIGYWLGTWLQISRAKILSLAGYFGYENGTIGRTFRSFRGVVDVAVVVLVWWFCKRIRRWRRGEESVERLKRIIKEKDEVRYSLKCPNENETQQILIQ